LLFPIPYDGGLGTTEQGNAVEGSLRTDLLNETDHVIERDDTHRADGIERAAEQEQGSANRMIWIRVTRFSRKI
jgi:hypothetical protein